MELDQSISNNYDPRVIFPIEHMFLHKVLTIHGGSDALVLKYDQEGSYLVAGCKDGSVRIISTNDKNNTLFTLNPE